MDQLFYFQIQKIFAFNIFFITQTPHRVVYFFKNSILNNLNVILKIIIEVITSWMKVLAHPLHKIYK